MKRKTALSLLLIIAASLAVRMGALGAAVNARPVFDEMKYLSRARSLLSGQGYVGSYQSWVRHPDLPEGAIRPEYQGAYQPPLYPTFLAAVLFASGDRVAIVKVVQVVLSALTVMLVFFIGQAWMDDRRGLIAAAIAAFYPNLIAFSHYLYTETVFIFLLLLALFLLTRRNSPPPPGSFLASGFLFGLCSLARSSFFYFVPLFFLWILLRHWRDRGVILRRAFPAAAVFILTLVPWTVRNYAVHDGLVLIETAGPFNLWRGNAPSSFEGRDRVRSYRYPFHRIPLMPVGKQSVVRLVDRVRKMTGIDRPTDLQVRDSALRLALGHIAAAPETFVRRSVLKFYDMWNPTSFLLRHFEFKAYGDVSPLTESLLVWAAVVAYLAVIFLGIVGGFSWRRDPRCILIGLFLLYYTAAHMTTFGLTRFRLPLMPLIILLAAHGAVVLADRVISSPGKKEGQGKALRP